MVGVKWCDIHKEWYVNRAWISQCELIQSNLIKHLKEIHLYTSFFKAHLHMLMMEVAESREPSILKLLRRMPHSESFDFKLFILIYQEYFRSSEQNPIYSHVWVRLLALVLNFPQRSCLGFQFTKL